MLFVEAIFDALGLDNAVEAASLTDYKRAFTAKAVRRIYEAVVELWPKHTNIRQLLGRAGEDVSGIYIGDYDPKYLSRALVRHSIYANKILLVDPFMHPYITSNEYNPINNPEQHRAQTLRNVNFYLSVLPWIDAGIVEFIRTPADFDRRLNFDSIRRAQALVKNSPELQAAINASRDDLKERHHKDLAMQDLILGAPDSYLRRVFHEINRGDNELTEDDFISYVNSRRDADPDFLEPLGSGASNSQLRMTFAGGTYEMARLAAQMARSYIFTDLRGRWAIIEHDRKQHTGENAVWSSFAKALQNAKLYYLNNLNLDHALRLRKEGRLEGVRSVMTTAWEKVRGDQPFSEVAAVDLANKLTEAVNEAEAEWRQIKKDVVKFGGTGFAASIVPAAAAITSGHGLFVAAAAIAGSASLAAWSKMQKGTYLRRYPAAFLMELRAEVE